MCVCVFIDDIPYTAPLPFIEKKKGALHTFSAFPGCITHCERCHCMYIVIEWKYSSCRTANRKNSSRISIYYRLDRYIVVRSQKTWKQRNEYTIFSSTVKRVLFNDKRETIKLTVDFSTIFVYFVFYSVYLSSFSSLRLFGSTASLA